MNLIIVVICGKGIRWCILRAIKRFKFLENACWCMGGESQYQSKFTHEKCSKTVYFVSHRVLSCIISNMSFLFFKWTNILKIFQKMYACGIAADFVIVWLHLDYLLYIIYMETYLVVNNLQDTYPIYNL